MVLKSFFDISTSFRFSKDQCECTLHSEAPPCTYLPRLVNVICECPLAQTAVSLAYGVGPLLGGYLSETVGFTTILRTVGCINFCYIPVLFFLKKTTSTDRSGYEQHSNVEQQVKIFFRKKKKDTFLAYCKLKLNFIWCFVEMKKPRSVL